MLAPAAEEEQEAEPTLPLATLGDRWRHGGRQGISASPRHRFHHFPQTGAAAVATAKHISEHQGLLEHVLHVACSGACVAGR